MGDTPLIVPATGEEIDKVRGYRVTKWHEYPNYECVYCQYSTLWIAKMEKHQAEGDHPWAYPGQNKLPEGVPSQDNEPVYE